jgi:hypothetical protein
MIRAERLNAVLAPDDMDGNKPGRERAKYCEKKCWIATLTWN